MTARTLALTVRCVPGSQQLYRYLELGKTYDPGSSYPSRGRFGDGSIRTLYLAASPEAAMAEFFRRHPEFLQMQDDVLVQLFEIDIEVAGECLDVRTDAGQAAADITRDRLTSSDLDESVRYTECRSLALWSVRQPLAGIAYPSAAAQWDTWNLVLFGQPAGGMWLVTGSRQVPPPFVDESQVRVLV